MSGWYNSVDGYSRKELRHALKRADPSLFELLLQFLENDPKTFGSGYAKVMMWQYIRRYYLETKHVERLEQAALKYLRRPMRPEYKRMCQTMAHIGTASFWAEVEKYLDSDNPVMRVNAYCLYQYSEGLEPGERERLELIRIKREIRTRIWKNNRLRYGPYLYGKHVLEAVTNPAVWKDNQIVYREPKKNDLPILRRGDYPEFVSIDFRQCDPDKVIIALTPILMEGSYSDISTISAWVLIFYVFGELGSNQALPLIERFYDIRIAHQFESAKKWLTVQAIFRALQKIGTPEALQASLHYIHTDSMNDNHMRSFTTGWLVND